MMYLQGSRSWVRAGRLVSALVLGFVPQLMAPNVAKGVLTEITETDFVSPELVTFDNVIHFPFDPSNYTENGAAFGFNGGGLAVVGDVLRWNVRTVPLGISIDTPISRFGFVHFSQNEDGGIFPIALVIDSITTFADADLAGASETFDFTNGGNQAGASILQGAFWGVQTDDAFQSLQINFNTFFNDLGFASPTAVLDDFRYELGAPPNGGGGGGGAIPEPATAALAILALIAGGVTLSCRHKKHA